MIRKLWIVIAVLFMAAMFVLKANAQQPTSSGKSQGHGEAAQLQQEIESLRQQAEPIRTQLQQIEAQAKPLREQLRSIQHKIKADREKLQNLRGEHREHHEQKQQNSQTQQQQTPTATPHQQ